VALLSAYGSWQEDTDRLERGCMKWREALTPV
jgi:hypothetical protein